MPPPWLASMRALVQPVAGAIPAVLIVLFAGTLALLGLFVNADRRAYTLDYADRLTDLATVILGNSRRPGQRPAA